MFTASGKFKLAPAVENMEVAAAAGCGGGHSNDGLSSRADRKRKAMGGPGGQIKDRKRKPSGECIRYYGW